MRFDFKCSCIPPTVLLWLLLCPYCGYLFLMGSNILLLMVVQQLVAILVFSKEKISACPSTPPPGSGFLMGSIQGDTRRSEGGRDHLLTLVASGRVAAGSSPAICSMCPSDQLAAPEHDPWGLSMPCAHPYPIVRLSSNPPTLPVFAYT